MKIPRGLLRTVGVLVALSTTTAPASEFEVSISASATDPEQNHVTSLSANEFSLYLWCTCAAEGVAALEAVVVTDYIVTAFEPASGVLNAGTADHLRLALGGCPGVGKLVGQWSVVDSTETSSGGFCLATPAGAAATCRVDDCILLGNPSGYVGGVVGFSEGDSVSCASAQGCGETTTPRAGSPERAGVKTSP